MSNKWLVSIIVICLVYLLLGHLTNLRSYRSLPHRDLVGRETTLKIEIAEMKKADVENTSDEKQLYRLSIERAKLLAEIKIRQFYVDQLITMLFIVALLLVFVNRLRKKQNRLATTKEEVIRDMSVHIENPREEYIEEWELDSRTRDGYKTKEEAIRWLKSDPMLTCDYCGAQLRSTYTGERESIQLVTFYKNVPEGAKDLRVVFGSYWFPKHANELRCSQCGKVEKR